MHKALARWLPEGAGGAPPTDPKPQANRIAHLVVAAGREGMFRANCLEQSLTLWWLLRRRGFEAELRIGARKKGETFEAHAWVELEGAVLNDDEGVAGEFARFERDLASVEAHSR
jgi:Transglutaminase-like superfamily